MKRLFAAALAVIASVAFGATTIPPSMLTPTGSTSGQVIRSNGPTSAPSWQSVTFGILPTMAANTVLGNASASTATPAAISLPSCSAANSGLQYTSGTGFSCGTTFALTGGTLAQFAATTSSQLAGVISDETGSGALVFGTSPTITTPNIVGVTGGGNANAGSVGERPTPTNLTNVALTTTVAVNVSSASLTAGDYEVQCDTIFNPAATTTATSFGVGVSTTSATFGANGTYSSYVASMGANTGNPSLISPTVPINVASTTTVYCVSNATFAVSTMQANGFMRARRVR
ncbi:hypothetical protein SAMN04487926_12168 [Paraburkholderia steynii]|uniref:Phage tail protein n=1 Tax=Paraburkholderia steynii TaxID=1245441 RepID=A0A7Z7BC04_9BURK|nr:hypothetical protein [Paraburkholderia steynii]SDI65551.1 hypothetical protein SAMN04487926_12168 [Paraburkholderia steynii]